MAPFFLDKMSITKQINTLVITHNTASPAGSGTRIITYTPSFTTLIYPFICDELYIKTASKSGGTVDSDITIDLHVIHDFISLTTFHDKKNISITFPLTDNGAAPTTPTISVAFSVNLTLLTTTITLTFAGMSDTRNAGVDVPAFTSDHTIFAIAATN